MTLPRFVVCEDGHEYTERFTRLFGARFFFERTSDLAAARTALHTRAAGLLLDLDFRRIPGAALVDEAGACRTDRSEDDRRRLAHTQGILILRALRASGVTTPSLLFADLADADQAAYLRESLAPLTIIPSSAALPTIAAALAALAAA